MAVLGLKLFSNCELSNPDRLQYFVVDLWSFQTFRYLLTFSFSSPNIFQNTRYTGGNTLITVTACNHLPKYPKRILKHPAICPAWKSGRGRSPWRQPALRGHRRYQLVRVTSEMDGRAGRNSRRELKASNMFYSLETGSTSVYSRPGVLAVASNKDRRQRAH